MYGSVYINCEKESMLFYTQYLKFTLYKYIRVSNYEEWWILKKEDIVSTSLILIKETNKKNTKNCLVLDTTDCIVDYCHLKENGVIGLSEPIYTDLGLVIKFLDCDGNKVFLLEERKYNELDI